MTTYSEAFAPLEHIYLEDSWVLSVSSTARSVMFDLEVVLTESHPDYQGPLPGEQYDYRHATLVVSGDRVEFTPSGRPPATDASGGLDYGHIDSWTRDEGEWSSLEGEWGMARVHDAHVQLTLSRDPDGAPERP